VSERTIDPYDAVRALAPAVSNWGRWGPDDEIGTLNLITPDASVRGARCVRTGRSFVLGLPVGPHGPQLPQLTGRFNPLHYMTAIGAAVGDAPGFHYSDDVVVMPLQASTQWDSLAHVHYDGQLYNGVADDALGVDGAARNGIDRQARVGLVTRGVLVDIARRRDVERLAAGSTITPEELDDALDAAGVRLEPGDALLVRTGHARAWTHDRDRRAYLGPAPGIGLETVPWLRHHDLAAIATDTPAVEVVPAQDRRLVSPVHLLAIRDMGLMLGEMFDLEALAEDCAHDGVHDFLFVAQPLDIERGVGSPVNPLAVK